MICPLIIAGWNAATGGDEVYKPDCLKQACAWWDEEENYCSVKVIAKKLSLIQHRVKKES